MDLGDWAEERVNELVEAFLQVRFPTILLLNKADQVSKGRAEAMRGSGGDVEWTKAIVWFIKTHPHQAGDTDKNIARIVERYDSNKCFVAR